MTYLTVATTSILLFTWLYSLSGIRGSLLDVQVVVLLTLAQYLVTRFFPDKFQYEERQRFRYISWFITTPLLLRAYYLQAWYRGYRGDVRTILLANNIGLILSWYAQSRNKFWEIALVASVVCYLYVLYRLYQVYQYLFQQGTDTSFVFGAFWTFFLFPVLPLLTDDLENDNLGTIMDILIGSVIPISIIQITEPLA